MTHFNLLKHSHFFEHFNDEEMQALQKITQIKTYEKDSVIFYKGDAPKYLHFILEGVVEIYKHDKKEREVILLKESGVSSFAELATLEQIPYPANCKSMTRVTIAFIDYEIFQKQFLSFPAISIAIIKSLSTRVRSLSSLIDRELLLSAEQKVASYLHQHFKEIPQIRHHQIATELNIAPETLSRVLGKFYNEGIISSRQPIVVENPELLARVIDL